MPLNFSLPHDLYDRVLRELDHDSGFFEWDTDPSLKVGKVCLSHAYYEKELRWYLKEDHYDPINEDKSTWTAHEYSLRGGEPATDEKVKKYFSLEGKESLVSVPGKKRAVILVKDYLWDWLHPVTPGKHLQKWLIIPIFSYRLKHERDYRFMLRDFCFKSPDRVFMPMTYGVNPGMNKECAAHLNNSQLVRSEYIEPLLVPRSSLTDQMHLKISNTGMKLILYHQIRALGLFDTFIENKNTNDYDEYDVFKWAINDIIGKSLKDQGLSWD